MNEPLLPLDSAPRLKQRYCPHCGGNIDTDQILNWGGWSFNEQQNGFELGTPGDKVHLTMTEARIVASLIRGQGRVVSKEGGLYSAICGDRPDVDWPEMKMVDVLVCKVRKKLKEANLLLAETSWGKGYFALPYDPNPVFRDMRPAQKFAAYDMKGRPYTPQAMYCSCGHLKGHHKAKSHKIKIKGGNRTGTCLVDGCACKGFIK